MPGETIVFIRKILNRFRSKSGIKENDAQIQNQKNIALRYLLTFARDRSPWYKKLLKNVPIQSFTQKHLMDLPILTKTTLMEHWDEIVTDRSLNLNKIIKHLDKMSQTEEVLPLDNKYLVLSTGGSSGKKGIFVYDYETVKKTIEAQERFSRKRLQVFLNLEPNERPKVAQVLVKNSVHGMYAFSKLSNQNDRVNYYFPVTRHIEEIIEGLNQTQPHMISGLPSTIRKLCQSAKSGHLKINPGVISVCAEPLYEPIRELIYQTWPKVLLFNTYGTTEGVVATNCKPNILYMHLYIANRMFFPVTKNNQTVNMGDWCDKLIYTNLNYFTIPLINYEIEDRIRFMSEPCSCGNPHPVIEEPKGRTVNDFVYPGNISVHYLNFSTPLLADGYVVEFHVMQTINGVKINLVSNGPVKKDKIINSIQQSFSNLGLGNAKVEIVEVSNINYLPSGKLQRFTPLD
ncbi:phenylacetate--CoA ligase family protein [Legionella shakespearei]|uniref:Coenzyme F390 synthetase n=1 Tax=Legionella shakespearei DSM 23087 TaxID=1122169 RepID=A0A0W0YZS4_9GAMM|nr:phenylacetate--CoA ligase family protein [Legionella shakespearei]KTD62359.1 coenzyme F390 synthetase [Legionella shakespearei DSM 23087]